MSNDVIGTAVMGAVGTWLAFAGVRGLLGERTRHLKENYRGRRLIATAGLVLVLPLGLGAAGVLSADLDAWKSILAIAGAAFVMAVLGLVDDLYGSRRAGGLVGHARELASGNVTTGIIKALGGAVVGLAAAALMGHRGVWIVVGGALIALAANMANLLDLRPARTSKVFVPLGIALVWIADGTPVRRVVASVIGGAVVFAYYELKEIVMLGDVGANLLGTVLGAGAVASLSPTSMAASAAVLLTLTLLAERFSFTRIIAAVAPLRWLDELGRIKA